ncbi:SDR family oxidoreductase [Caenimonas koreensis DSM 17982]|uniref:SDR family oxidoreductase n=1 Tax=Caenimonas koreensis DSM 17982 TaxID=1121255 RepID=A0A844B3A8_9BURK|nr:SDR family oxidoreductase [Caenimonas koreensis]MRD47722.1 SDR family oxidoreductase [Caenimonas koreensis DSM 17982]
MSDAFRLDGKVVVLTGAAGIIGSEVTRNFLEAGARVFAIDRDAGLMQDKLGAQGDSLMHCVADVANPESVKAARAVLEAKWGSADALLNNAATKSDNFFEPFETFPLADWNEVMGVNLTGAMLCAQAFGAGMAARGKGSIVNTLSIYGIVAPDQRIYEGSQYMGRAINTPAIYSASKAGLWGLTKYLASYWGAKGVRVNAITPGGVFSGQNDTFVENYSSRAPLGRMAQADDMANAMRFLVSDASKYMTGHNLVVDGGWTAW